MWYRVEFNRDGSIKESRPVEARGTDGGHVCYIDADGTTEAVKQAVAWRTRYLESARNRKRADREVATKQGLCRGCLRRQVVKGKRRCVKCLSLQDERRGEPHVVRHASTPTIELAAKVSEGIARKYGRQKVSGETVLAVLRGASASISSTSRIARALREMGCAASSEKTTAKPRGGGRYSLAETELELLLAVEHSYQALTAAQFSAWLTEQIVDRRSRARRTVEAA